MSVHANAPAVLHPTQNPVIRVVSHSTLFYWWPVWLTGFVLALLTFFDGSRLAAVPAGTRVETARETAEGSRYTLTVPGKPTESLRAAAAASSQQQAFPTRVADTHGYGIFFTFVLLFVILFTNVAFRGLWSVFALMVIVLVVGLFAALDWWGAVLAGIGDLRIYLSAAGYLVPSLVLFILWLATVFLYDQRRYMSFSPGQFVVHREVGDLREIHDTTNLTVEKRRSDLFRNWILGFGSGDLLVQTPGAQGQLYTLSNVLFAARRVKQIADLMKTRPVVPE
jgi:hypothetical protein